MYEKKHVCRNCAYYKNFYTKGIAKFYSKRYGECENLKKQVTNNEGCDLWEDNSELKALRQKSFQSNILFALENINEIINIIKTELDEE